MKKLLILPFLVWQLCADSLYVVTSKTNGMEPLSKKELRDLFLLKKKFVTQKKVVVVNLLASHPLRLSFEQHILEMNRNKLNAYWVKKHFQGITPPVSQASTQAMKKFLQNVENSIGYLPQDLLDDSLKVLYEF
ncbi:MAG: hypothetical protein J7J31_02115 [Helicobacteraceae bacterium]|nr:hypothetical protein [Helicobacteraceae bacterium]